MSFILGRLSPGSITLMRAGVKGHPENLRKFIHFGDRSIPFLCNHRQRFDNHPDGRWWWWCISNITQISQSRVMLLVYISEVPCSDVLVSERYSEVMCVNTYPLDIIQGGLIILSDRGKQDASFLWSSRCFSFRWFNTCSGFGVTPSSAL